MNDRIKRQAQRALDGDKAAASDFSDIYNTMLSVDDGKKIRMIKDSFSQSVKIDDDALLVGESPSFKFWERKRYPCGTWQGTAEKYGDLKNKLFMLGGNHKSADFGYVINNGFAAYMNRIEQTMQTVTDIEKQEFLDDMYFACKAISAWAQAHGAACEKAASLSSCPERKNQLLNMARACTNVPLNPARSFFEAVQSYYFMFLLFPDGLGRIDQYLYPHYKKDLENGAITRQEALDLIEELFVKIFAYLGKDDKKSASHHGVVAGYTQDGACAHNECTSLILEALTELPLWRPQISYRVTKKTAPQQFREALDANLKRPDLVMFLNDDVIVTNMQKIGIPFEDAVNYSVSGCNETTITGCSQLGSLEGHVNLMHSFEQLMKNVQLLKSIHSFDEFYSALEGYLKTDLDIITDISYARDKATVAEVDVISSLLTEGCIESAACLPAGGAKYNHCTWCMTGLINLADCLSIIKQTVFEEKKFSLAQLSNALSSDWIGFEDMRSYILENGRYFGNDDDYVDSMVNKIAASACSLTKDCVPYRGGKYIFGTLTGYEISHIVFGKVTGASPDGRKNGDPFAASVSSYPDADKNGMTAYLKSAAKIDGGLIPSSVVVNITVDRAFVDTAEKRRRFADMLTAYFGLGGVHLQINYLSAKELVNAQKNPEKYRNLRVRVTGFSGFFTTFDKALQDELISRTMHSA